MIGADATIQWHWANAKPERQEDGSVVWYGTFQDITERKEYIKTLEQLLFEISHVMRKPVANILGLTEALKRGNLDKRTLQTFLGYIQTESRELEEYIKKLDTTYYATMVNVADPRSW